MSNIKILTCGSVDDGKSTLIGRIMHDTNNLYIDQSDYLTELLESQNEEMDFSLLLDGLLDEKEQKITIDAAFKYLSFNVLIIASNSIHIFFGSYLEEGTILAGSKPYLP